MNMYNIASASSEFYKKCLWSNSPTGVIFTTCFTGFLFGNLAEAMLSRPETCFLKDPYAHPPSFMHTRHCSYFAEKW